MMPLWVVQVAGGVAALALGFGGGFYACSQFDKAEQVEVARAETKKVADQAKVTAVIDTQNAEKQAEIRTVYKTITKEVVRYVNAKDDAACDVPDGFVRLWNSASSGAIPGAASGVDAAAAATRSAAK